MKKYQFLFVFFAYVNKADPDLQLSGGGGWGEAFCFACPAGLSSFYDFSLFLSKIRGDGPLRSATGNNRILRIMRVIRANVVTNMVYCYDCVTVKTCFVLCDIPMSCRPFIRTRVS